MLRTVSWDVRPGDPERRMDAVQRRYPSGRFEKLKAKWETPHMSSRNVLLADRKLGLTIVFDETRAEVIGIEWVEASAGSAQ